ncbi:MAG: adenosylcobinamide-GDP ribazoletransferase [Candidatus Altiarchaeum hamiconexum]|uniref:Adenosylcobinamide-GDP ribazoletransferase n=1 Tax=Candidatus Altarchaeum hamiconexum TaxID=1803513 RepID=A0A8J8CIA2_9ARCH|nr:adenosylcobinamide-GDP ribazoletransferase [Candidatus Altarchaeum hamiconexum]OIQ04853.1 MAG: hypothetical protein AUK59_06145 [Candidatus Altarchaeum sp. CG2_30_32_3053]PIN67245.1 MAG: hypothetical protein COV98_03905 [Candidatus Altarchaeum sp. CG12_big_fil_rev_8_21_14_0_65_33_22]PIV27559.1 MAG: hypothetical protein COS36_05280 [Candidatus Altarchaeum sp. CG03_land_8_20_14_0_80_32_618]PJC14604.1 MAG: hypothetical protein CO063_02540 [Candidatus Altarchaeum sp. CG_4_9_14_0_8_um_filter_32_2
MNPIISEIKKFLYALQFLTIIKFVNVNAGWNENFAAKSVAYFPLVGILIGCILAVAYFTLSFIFPKSTGLTTITAITAIILIIIETVLTRGLHLDGFIDTVDGLFGGMNKEERLRIMKDTHPGSFGIIAVVLLILLKWTLISEILILNLNSDKILTAGILILMPALGRYAMLIPMAVFPYARSNGTGGFTKFVKFKEILTAGLFIILPVIAISFVFLNLNINIMVLLMTLIIALLIFSLMVSKYIASKINGMTGDTYGAITEISEIFVLLAFVSGLYCF